MVCAFRPPIYVGFGSYEEEKNHYRDWVRRAILQLEGMSIDELDRATFLFWKYYVLNCNMRRDRVLESVDTALLHYFHHRGLLRFLQNVHYVPCSHCNKYELCVRTKYGDVRRSFSSVREVRSATGLDFRKELRKILYK